jgi:hypothetical protein
MTLQIAMAIPDPLPEASVAPISGVEAVGGEEKGFAEGAGKVGTSGTWRCSDDANAHISENKRPPQLAALTCFLLGSLIGICGAGLLTTGDDLSSEA